MITTGAFTFWILAAFLAGVFIGIFTAALLCAASRDRDYR